MIASERVANCLAEETGIDVSQWHLMNASGGDTHTALYAQSPRARLFLKISTKNRSDVLASEYASLKILHETQASQWYPKPMFLVQKTDLTICAMERLELESIETNSSKPQLCADQLAEHHLIVHEAFGWEADNFIGANLQANNWDDSWLRFFMDQRLAPQVQMLRDKKLSHSLLKDIGYALERVPLILGERNIRPSLVHGDLWTGNLAWNNTQERLSLYDPAPYYGDPEVDIAMTRLFGTLPKRFYSRYREHNPLPRDREEKLHAVYNLYHALNHLNLFGSGYAAMVNRFIGEIRSC